MKRQRGRGRKPGNQQNRSFESNGPDVKIRGNASTIYEKYLQLARDATSSGDRVMAENYYQHAEHYYRIVQANQPKRDESKDEESGDQRGPNQGQQAQGGDQGDQQRSDERGGGRGRGRGRGRGGDDQRAERSDHEGETRAEQTSEDGDGEPGGSEPKPRRSRRKKAGSEEASDPLAVVNPEGEQDSSQQSGGSELTAEEAPKRKRAPRKPRADKAAQEALDKVGDGGGESDSSGGDEDIEAA